VMGLVGTTLQWRGDGKAMGGRLWRASGVPDSYPVGWGVVCTGYTPPQKALPDQNGGKDTVYKDMYRSQFMLHVAPTGNEGTIDPRRPSAEQG
jgi:hypothetical protein